MMERTCKRLATLSAVLVAAGCTARTGLEAYGSTGGDSSLGGDPTHTSGDGTVPGDSAGDALVSVMVVVEPAYPNNGANWNDYVRADGTSAFDATDVACNPTTDTACWHAGVLRVVEVPTMTSCAGATITDTLGAFKWLCDDESSDAAVHFRSTGLRHDAGLADLVDVDHWRDNAVTIFAGSTTVATSTPSTWWSNPVAPLPDNATSATLLIDGSDDDGSGPDGEFRPGTIFTVASDQDSVGYNFDIDRFAVVTAATATLHFTGSASNCNDPLGEITSPNTRVLLCAGQVSFSWTEGNFDGGNARDLIYYVFSNFGQFRRVRCVNGDNCIQIEDGLYNRISQVRSASSTIGLLLWTTDYTAVWDVIASNAIYGVRVSASSNGNVLTRIVSVNNEQGIYLQTNSNGNTFSHVLVANNSTTGIQNDGPSDNAFNQIVAVNNANAGIEIAAGGSFQFSHIVTTNNESFGFLLNDGESAFFGELVVGNNGSSDCRLTGAAFANMDTGDTACTAPTSAKARSTDRVSSQTGLSAA